jgi:hypothetical protein
VLRRACWATGRGSLHSSRTPRGARKIETPGKHGGNLMMIGHCLGAWFPTKYRRIPTDYRHPPGKRPGERRYFAGKIPLPVRSRVAELWQHVAKLLKRDSLVGKDVAKLRRSDSFVAGFDSLLRSRDSQKALLKLLTAVLQIARMRRKRVLGNACGSLVAGVRFMPFAVVAEVETAGCRPHRTVSIVSLLSAWA